MRLPRARGHTGVRNSRQEADGLRESRLTRWQGGRGCTPGRISSENLGFAIKVFQLIG